MHGMHGRGSSSASIPGTTPPATGVRSVRTGHTHMGDTGANAPAYSLAPPRRTASAAVLTAAPHSHTHVVHAHAHAQALVRVRSGTGMHADNSGSGSMSQRLHHTRSASTALLQQLQGAPHLEDHIHEAPMLTASFSHHTKHTTVHAGPLALSVSSSLLDIAQRCVTVATGVLPQEASSAIVDTSPACMLLAAADAAAQCPQGPTATVRIHSASLAIRLPAVSHPDEGGSNAESQVCSQVAVAQCEVRVGTVAHPSCIARLVDDVRTIQDRVPQLHAFSASRGGAGGDSTNTPLAPRSLQHPAASWQQCAHACGSARAGRGPVESLAIALTTPLHVNVLDSSASLMLSQQGDQLESHMHVVSPTSSLHPLYNPGREPFPVAYPAPVATLGTARANMRLPIAQFAPVAANLALHELVAQVDQAHIDSAQCLMEACGKYACIAQTVAKASAGNHTARRTGDSSVGIPPLEVRVAVNNALVTVSRGGEYRDDACASVSWSQLHASFCSDTSGTVLRSVPMHYVAAPAVAFHTCMFGDLAPDAPAVFVEVSEFEVTCLNGCIGDVMHDMHAYIPPRTVRAAFSHMAARVRLQAPYYALQCVTADIYNLRADAASPADDEMQSPMASCLNRTQPHAWDAPPQPLRVIGTSSTAHEHAQVNFSFDGGHNNSAAVAEASSSLVRIAFSNIGKEDVQTVFEGDARTAQHMYGMHARGSTPAKFAKCETPFGSAVSVLILRGRVCAQYLTEIFSGWPKDPSGHKASATGTTSSGLNSSGVQKTDVPGVAKGASDACGTRSHTFHAAHSHVHDNGNSSASQQTCPRKPPKGSKEEKGSGEFRAAAEPISQNIALSLDIVDSELFVMLPGKSPTAAATVEAPPVATTSAPGRRKSTTTAASQHGHALQFPPLATALVSQSGGQEGACATLHIKRWYLLVHSELLTVTSGLSMPAVVAIKATEQQAEALRDSAGCMHERVATGGRVSHSALEDVPPMTPMTGFTFNGGPVGAALEKIIV